MKFSEHECVVLTVGLPAERLEPGDVGAVVHVHEGGTAYEVEFVALDGHTVTVATVDAAGLRPVSRLDLAHARELRAG